MPREAFDRNALIEYAKSFGRAAIDEMLKANSNPESATNGKDKPAPRGRRATKKAKSKKQSR